MPYCCSSLQDLHEHGTLQKGDVVTLAMKGLPERGQANVPNAYLDERLVDSEQVLVIVQPVPYKEPCGVYEGREESEKLFTNPTRYAKFALSLREDTTLKKYMLHINGWKDVEVNGITLFKIRQETDQHVTAEEGGAGSSEDVERKLYMAAGSQWLKVREGKADYYWHPFTEAVQVEAPAGFLGTDLLLATEAKVLADKEEEQRRRHREGEERALRGGKGKGKKKKGGGKSKKRPPDPEAGVVDACDEWTEEQLELWLRHMLRHCGTPMRAPVPERVRGMLAALHAVRKRRAAAAGMPHLAAEQLAEQMEIDQMIESLDL